MKRTVVAMVGNNMDMVTTTREFDTEFGKLELGGVDECYCGIIEFKLSKISSKWIELIHQAVKIEMDNCIKTGEYDSWGNSGVLINPTLELNTENNNVCQINVYVEDKEDESKICATTVPYVIPFSDGLKFAIAGMMLEEIIHKA